MTIKLKELIDMLYEINTFEYIIYDKKENNYIFVDLNMMFYDEYEEILEKVEFDEKDRLYRLHNRYNFHDSEIIEEYINSVNNEKIQKELEFSFYGKGKYRKFKDTLARHNILDNYYKFREKYLKEIAIEWCNENKLEYEE